MLIKQYRITLPADYDMQIIRNRVENRGASFDTFAGLGLKCFLIREKGKFGAAANEYSPVYLWPQADAMWDFLAGPAFAGVKDAFGVPPIETWSALVFARSERLGDPTSIASVTREEEMLMRDTDLRVLRDSEIRNASECVNSADEKRKGPLARAVGIDPRSWRLVRFDYWEEPQSDLPANRLGFEVLHVSAPAFDQVTAQRRA